MNTMSIKTHFDRNVFITFLVLLLVGFSLLSFKMDSTVNCDNVGFEVISDSYTAESLIEFKSTDTSGVEWEWNFGDGSAPMYRSDVVHQFTEPGKYIVSLQMNGQCVTTRNIAITEGQKRIDPALIPNILLPKHVRVGEEVVFANDSEFAESWQWSFGETHNIDGTNKKERYTFKRPGEKTILLVVNEDLRHEAKQRITVLPALKERKKRNISRRTDPIEAVLRQQIMDKPLAETEKEKEKKRKEDIEKINRIEVSQDQLQQMLMGYSNRRIDDSAIRNYFCYSNIPVFSKTGERFTVSQFFNEIRDVKMELNAIKMVRDTQTGCIKSLTVDMRTKKGLFWKKF